MAVPGATSQRLAGGERARRWLLVVRLVGAIALLRAGVVVATAEAAGGSAATGERLFEGRERFAKGGPPCSACHAVAGLPWPGGGTMGPDLTEAYDKYGPEPLDTVLASLFFPTMAPLFAGRLLTPGERADLEAFLAAQSGQQPPPARGATARLFVPGALLCAAFAAAMAWLGRNRLRGVRSALVRGARAAQRTRS